MLLYVAVGGAIGATLRFLISSFIHSRVDSKFPLGTLAVNLIGAFLVGVMFAILVERLSIPPAARLMLITGIMGGFTTFSTFSYESFHLLQSGETLKFASYVLITNLIGIALTFAGYHLGRVI